MPTDNTSNPNSQENSAHLNSQRYKSLIEGHATQLVEDLFQDLESDLSGLKTPSARRSHSVVRSDRARSKTESSGSGQDSSIVLSLPPAQEELIPYVPFESAFLELERAEQQQRDADQRLLPADQEHSQGLNQRWVLSIGLTALVCSIGVWVGAVLQNSTPASSVAQTPLTPAPQSTQSPSTLLPSGQPTTPTQSSAAIPSPVAVPLRAHTVQPVVPNTTTIPATKTVAVAIPGVTPSKAVVSAPQKIAPSASTLPNRSQARPPKAVVIPVKAVPTLAAKAGMADPAQQTLPSLSPNSAPQPLPISKASGKSGQPAGITIQGILELGDQSALLLARNGSTQQVRIGEALDGSGWRLTRVENGRAVIQRGDETRSVEEGEKF
jgi:hypothetical protein